MCECGCVEIVKFSGKISADAFLRDGVCLVVYAARRQSFIAFSG